MHVRKERSCGVIPFRLEKGVVKFLVVRNIGRHWEFPKGHKEKGESDRATARREFNEETGLKVVKLLRKSYHEFYTYTWKGEKRAKKVTYFLGMVSGGKVKIQEDEIIGHAWLPYRLALKKLTFSEVKIILKSAKIELAQHLN